MDDTAVLRPTPGGDALLYTLDVITPIVDDAEAFGRIAATNALSDVYAMGGSPQVALSFVGIPTEVVGEAVVADVMRGMNDACLEAGAAIVGGHTMKDAEPKCGLAVIGIARDPWTQTRAKPGDVLVLSKPVGTGLIGQAIQKDLASDAQIEAAVKEMTRLNKRASALGLEYGVNAATDVTGFGLLGHLRHIVQASKVAVELHASRVPFLPGAKDFATRGVVPGGSRRNLTYAEVVTTFADDVDEATRLVLADAQTSGGLLMTLPADAGVALKDALVAEGHEAAIIGEVTGSGEGAIRVD